MKARLIAITLMALAGLGLWLLPASALAARAAQTTETPQPTPASCLTLPPEQQSGCFATKVAEEELLRQTQEVIGITATAQAIEQQIQGTLAASGATPTPPPTVAALSPTPSSFSVAVPGLNIQLSPIGLLGLGLCGVGGIFLIALGVYLVRGAREEEGEAPPVTVPAADVRPLIEREAESAPATQPAPGTGTTVSVPPPPAAMPGGVPILVFGDGRQIAVTSGDFSIGRAAENDFVVDARFPGYENVSAEHARLVLDANQRWLIEDLGSANGTFVNGRPTTMNLLRDGWRVGFGPVEFTFRLRQAEEQP